jgi:hypothetical protein
LTSGIAARSRLFRAIAGVLNSIPALSAIADGFLAEAEFAEFCADAVHLRPLRVILGEEAFLQEEELGDWRLMILDF